MVLQGLEGVAKAHLCAGCLLGQDAQEVLGEVAQERRVPVPVVPGAAGAGHIRPVGQAPVRRNPPTPAMAVWHRAWHSRAGTAPPAVLETTKPQHILEPAALASALESERLS